MPKISVIVPIYKVEAYLKKCVDSILSQSFGDFDLILVDDGSPDRCPELCEELAGTDARIRVIHKENGGLSDARNAGIDWAMEHSDSRWLAFVDADDYLHPDYLKKLCTAALENGADMCMCDFERVDENGASVEKPHSFPEGAFRGKNEVFGMLYEHWRSSVAWNKLYKKSIFDGLRYDFGKLHEDEFIIHKVLARCDSVFCIDEPLYYYLIRSGSIMSFEKKISIKLIFLEAGISRYWFCKENGLPIDVRLSYLGYLEHVLGLQKDISEEERERYRKLKREYREVFADSGENRLKRKLIFDFYPQYKKLKGI